MESRLYKFVRPIISILFKIIFHPKVEGNIKSDGKVLLAGNHTSNLDCLLLMSTTKRPIHFFAKSELWNGFLGIFISRMGLIKVDRKKKNSKAIEEGCNYLNNDLLVLIFPEGTTEKEGVILDFKMGAVKMAHDTKTKISPFVITGKYRPFINNLKIKFLDELSVSNDFVKSNKKLYNIIKNNMEG